MKKILITASVLFLTSIAVSVSFAADFKSSGGRLVMGGTSSLEVGVSPNVVAVYRENHTGTTPPQWYLIATAHTGGTEAYATAQDITKVFKHTFTPGKDTLDTVIGWLPSVPTSEDAWKTTNNWNY